MTALIDPYDAAFFDLDGVVYVGPSAVGGAAEAMTALDARGTRVMYLTNNAARSNRTVVDHLLRLGVPARPDTVLTSAQVAAAALSRELPAGSTVLVAGSESLAGLIAEAGLTPVYSADDDPMAVVQGYDPQLRWPMLDEVCLAVARGARWYATNDDASRPTERGLVPGVGGMIAAIHLALGGEPVIFSKPFRPMLEEAVRRTGAARPILVGDRLDTDIAGARNVGIDSLLVFSGAHGKRELVAAGPGERPTYIGADIGALLAPARTADHASGVSRCRDVEARVSGDAITLSTVPGDVDGQLDALWAVATLAWRLTDAGEVADPQAALSALDLVR